MSLAIVRACLLTVLVAACGSNNQAPTASAKPPGISAATTTPAAAASLEATSAPAATSTPAATAPVTEAPEPSATQGTPFANAWIDATSSTIGSTADWSNKVELADINADGRVDLLFANGGDYDTPGTPVLSRVFANRPDGTFDDVSEATLGDLPLLTRVIKVRDIDADGNPDIVLGTTYQTQSQLLLGNGDGTYRNVTASNLPQMPLSVGDLEIGDVDADGDLDIVLADWGAGSPLQNAGGVVHLWLNDGQGVFTDATTRMPDTLVGFSWDIELVDVDNDWDLDVAVSCKQCSTSLLYENDGKGRFSDVTAGRMPGFGNNYEFAPMDIDGDGYLDLVTINDGPGSSEHVFRNDGTGAFVDATSELWPITQNGGYDDNVTVFLDVDSDGDADFLIGSLDGQDRLLLNDGAGHLTQIKQVFDDPFTTGTLGLGVADLNSDGRPDVVMAQGEEAEDERVFLGTEVLAPDTGKPVIATDLPDHSDGPVLVHARVHDNRTPNMPQDWQSITVSWETTSLGPQSVDMEWYGENLFRAPARLPPDATNVRVCAVDVAQNEECAPSV